MSEGYTKETKQNLLRGLSKLYPGILNATDVGKSTRGILAQYPKDKLIYEDKKWHVYGLEKEPRVLVLRRAGGLTADLKVDAEQYNKYGYGGSYQYLYNLATSNSREVHNNNISIALFRELDKADIPTYFLEKLDKLGILILKVEPIPLKIVLRNYAIGYDKIYGLQEGQELEKPLFEIHYKGAETNEHALKQLGAFRDPDHDCEQVIKMALNINSILKKIFSKTKITKMLLAKLTLEFGYDEFGNIVLIGDLSPNQMLIWASDTHRELPERECVTNHVVEGYISSSLSNAIRR